MRWIESRKWQRRRNRPQTEKDTQGQKKRRLLWVYRRKVISQAVVIEGEGSDRSSASFIQLVGVCSERCKRRSFRLAVNAQTYGIRWWLCVAHPVAGLIADNHTFEVKELHKHTEREAVQHLWSQLAVCYCYDVYYTEVKVSQLSVEVANTHGRMF